MSDPYLIHGPALISFSGGRTSAYMLWRILQAHGGTLPDDVHVCFANTGKEREETLRFVHECGTRWGIRVRWLEWRSRLKSVPVAERFEEVGFNSAARNGEPFAARIKSKKSTPNSVARWCTENLKVLTLQAFMEANGHTKYANVVGLRADESHRVAKGRERGSVMPLADAGITKRDVMAYWQAQDFDLGLLPFEGNCDACFLKARPKLWEVERTKPGTLQWWSDMEQGHGKGRFVTEYSYAELIRDVRRQPDMFAGGLFDDDPDMDAECGLWCAGGAS
ncbi:phosphoadenosine phosphosulfate reductase family protein [Novosphingobium sp. HII-3]|uniref:phosphoadenosine phosphosulfate reductase family protein n=1 Tax=Novosphingobium sp. HII-3 TaxID=2075565 RepID=UPI000CDA84F1|nr:phosphoadenosine phosphosulfate reductase family protein [Novosphingobium sp. HII-3]